MPSIKVLTLSLALATITGARTDLAGCTSSRTGTGFINYVPGTGEICDIPDCGGGRAPPITTNPACAGYQGTATYSPSFLPGFTGAAAVSQAGDGQVQATSAAAAAAAPISQIGDGQPQAPTGAASTKTAAAVSQITDGQPQAPQATSTPAPAKTVSAVSQITDGQPQAPASSAAPVSSAPASAPAAPAQPSSVTVPAVSQLTDGQPQAPKSTMATSVMFGNGTAQGPTTVSGVAAPTGTSSKPAVATFTGAASVFGFNKEVAGLAMGLAAGLAML